ncbi:hypothetical protein LEL86_27375 [Streptomyces sp. WA6-1-16]|uniref:hypothetical protein n=1 Tax=Streptomyces sp. WA6-1-16 TaxID=2879427 RepID=UPI000A238AE6|nr:hypothetical protein [Streptomyces sp. WA6-1-16]OSC74264.1 hypothetical protein B5180_13840 [Streptomyces sp. BF-3]UCA52779.1 hypothetical protein LEL86_27375 [Streptomyces sp. WA6-1-16]
MNTTPSKTTNTDETAAAEDAAAKDAPVTSPEAVDSATASDDLGEQAARDDAADDGIADEDLESDPFEAARHGVGAGAAAVVSAALGVVALTGAWTGRVAAERETLIGQIKLSGGGSAAQQISEIYGDAWHATALVNGVFALLALLVGVVVLVRPAFGAPAGRPQPAWVRAVALAGVALGVLGVLISAGMYLDLFVSLPSAGTPAGG